MWQTLYGSIPKACHCIREVHAQHHPSDVHARDQVGFTCAALKSVAYTPKINTERMEMNRPVFFCHCQWKPIFFLVINGMWKDIMMDTYITSVLHSWDHWHAVIPWKLKWTKAWLQVEPTAVRKWDPRILQLAVCKAEGKSQKTNLKTGITT